MKDFNGKVVVITGGATGIGKALADRFGLEGAKVVICARRENRLQEAVEDLRSKGIDARYKVCDVTKMEDVKALANYTWEEFGQVDVLVNNAGITGAMRPVVDDTAENYRKMYEINVFGVLNGIWAFTKRIIEQGTPGMIINVASEAGLFIPTPGFGAYASTKYALRAISETLRWETPDNIEVSIAFTGYVKSEIGGSSEATQYGMDTDEYVDMLWPQIEAGEFNLVAHPYGADYFGESAEEILNAYKRYAPHYEGDECYDTRQLAKFGAKSLRAATKKY